MPANDAGARKLLNLGKQSPKLIWLLYHVPMYATSRKSFHDLLKNFTKRQTQRMKYNYIDAPSPSTSQAHSILASLLQMHM